MRHLRRAATKDIVLGVMAVLVIGFAIYWAATHWGGKTDVTEGTVGFFCPKCNHHFSLTYSEFEKMTDRGDMAIQEGRAALYKCDQCGQITAQRWEQADTNAPAPEAAGG